MRPPRPRHRDPHLLYAASRYVHSGSATTVFSHGYLRRKYRHYRFPQRFLILGRLRYRRNRVYAHLQCFYLSAKAPVPFADPVAEAAQEPESAHLLAATPRLVEASRCVDGSVLWPGPATRRIRLRIVHAGCWLRVVGGCYGR